MGAWTYWSEGNDGTHDILSLAEEQVKHLSKKKQSIERVLSQRFASSSEDSYGMTQEIADRALELALGKKPENHNELARVGVAMFVLKSGFAADPKYLRRARALNQKLLQDEASLQEWSDPVARKKALRSEIKWLDEALAHPEHQLSRSTLKSQQPVSLMDVVMEKHEEMKKKKKKTSVSPKKSSPSSRRRASPSEKKSPTRKRRSSPSKNTQK